MTRKSFPLFIAILLGFIISLKWHFSIAMYPLSGVIFYYYLPMLYSYSRINVLQHIEANEFIHLKYYPMEFFLWLVAACFFSFILAHLLSDLLFQVKRLHVLMLPLIISYLGLIVYRETRASTLRAINRKMNFEKQGRLLTFEILFVFMFLFTLHQ